MGFLYYLLKDVSEKQPYKVGKTILNDIVTELGKRLSTGREGFSVIERVAEKVGEYNKFVKYSNDAVKDVIITMSSTTVALNEEVSAILPDEDTIEPGTIQRAVSAVDGKLAYCVKNSKTFLGSMFSVMNHTENLNHNLKSKVENAKKIVKHEYDKLRDLCDKERKNFNAMTECINKTMHDLKHNVQQDIYDRVNDLVEVLKQKVTEIKDKLEKIKTSLEEYIQNLSKWKAAGDAAVERAKQQCGVIVEKLQGSGDTGQQGERRKVTEAALQLQRRADDLRTKAYDAKQKVTALVREALTAVKTMDDALKKDLFTLKGKIKSGLLEYVKDEMLTEIRMQVESIKGKAQSSSSNQGIEGIKHNVEKYVRGFRSTFEGVIGDWVENIVQTNEPFKAYIWTYTNDNGKYFNSNEITGNNAYDKAKAVRTIVKQQIASEILEIANQDRKVISLTGKVDGDLLLINTFLQKFSADALKQAVKTVVRNVEGINGLNITSGKNGPSYNSDLTNAVRIVMHAISMTTEKIGEEIKNLAQKCSLSNINTALNIAASLDADIHKAFNTGGGTLKFAAKSVATRIADTVNDSLPDKTIGSTRNAVDIKPQYFENYNTYVNQDHVDALSKGSAEGGESDNKLPAAIAAIKTQVDDAARLGNVDDGNINADGKFDRKTFSSLHDQIIHNLDQFTTAVQNLVKGGDAGSDKTSVHAYLEDLEKMLGGDENYHLKSTLTKSHSVKGLKKLHDDLLDMLGGNLTKSINDAEKFIKTESAKSQRDCVEAIHHQVNIYVGYTELSLTTAARRNYVTSVKQLLTAFADKVSEELAELPGEIDRDLTIGFKGLMKTLEDGDTEPGTEKGKNLKELKELATQFESSGYSPENFKNLSKHFQKFFWPLTKYLTEEIARVNKDENKKKNPPLSDIPDPYTWRVEKANNAFNALLHCIVQRNGFNNKVPGLCDKVTDTIAGLKPDDFSKPNTPTIDCIPSGLQALVTEFRKAYISRYDGETFEHHLTINHRSEVNTHTSVNTYDLSDYGRKCANVCLTLLGTVYHDLCQLRNEFMSDRCLLEKIHLDDNNPLGAYFNTCGYHVSANAAKQNGELNKEKDGKSILKLLCKDKHIFDGNFYKGKLVDIHCYVERYYAVTHLRLINGAKPPTNIYEMCQWLLGLYYNPVYKQLEKQFKELFGKPEAYKNEESSKIPREQLKLDAYPEEITMGKLTDTLQAVCSQSYDILTNLLGHGHAGGRYASDFHTNKDNLLYPTDFNTLVCLLFDVLKRVHHQFYFLYEQCSYGSTLSGWQECWYGQGVGGSAWNCNTLRCPNQNTDQTAKQEHKQICNQKCNQNADCGLKSPLQSFLEDGLPGFMPHNVSVKGSGLSCATCIKTPGIPCKTPMGFSDIGHMASRRNIGSNIVSVLYALCGIDSSSLSVLCNIFSILLPSAPKTLGDMFAFYYNFLNGWDDSGEHRKTAFDGAVNKAYFEEYYNLDECADIFTHREHYSREVNVGTKPTLYHDIGDFHSICNSEETCYTSSKRCGSYIASLSTDVSCWFASKHAGLYLTWIIYSTETFYRLLCSFRDDCKSSCATAHSKCRISGCDKSICKVPKSISNENYEHVYQCNSIVQCRFTHPTLYSRGFTFGDRESLNGTTGEYNVPMRTCQTFVEQLDKVCHGKSLLSKLVNVTIPDFLFTIRAPFIWLNVALWLLSFLYLLHIMVIRLDLLHIKSHLHSPSSHRIAAQSLLAAARVNKLGKVFYLQQ